MEITAEQLVRILGAKEAELYLLKEMYQQALARIAELEAVKPQ